jgi:homospermidine synthase
MKKNSKRTIKIAYFSLLRGQEGDTDISSMIVDRGNRSARNITAVIDSDGFGGISVCSHKDNFNHDDGLLAALEYRDRARRFHKKTGVKVIMAKNQIFPAKEFRDIILNYVEQAEENAIVLNDD